MSTKTNYKPAVRSCYIGYICQAICCNFPPLLFLIFNDKFGIPLEQITLLITINFLTQLAIDFSSVYFVDKIGARMCAVLAHVFATVGFLCLGILPKLLPASMTYASLVIATVFYAMGCGLTEVIISPIVDACPSDNSAAMMSLLHSFYCWGVVAVVLFSTVFFVIFGTENWWILALLWAIIPAVNAVCFLRVPLPNLAAEEKQSAVGLFKMPVFVIMFIIMFAGGAAEQAMTQWASAYAESGLGVSKTIGDLMGPCFFAILMGTARVLFAKFGNEKNILKSIVGSAVLCVTAYLIVSVSPWPFLSLAACGICGFSVGIFWPGTLSLASKTLPGVGTAMFSLLALAGDLGCTSGPSAVGYISGIFNDNLKTGLLFGALFPVTILIFVFLLKRKTSRSIGN